MAAAHHKNMTEESNPSWRTAAACRDTDPDLFFPVGISGPALEQIEAAKAVCKSCEVQVNCLEFALATNQDHGIWGGTTEEERRTIRKTWITRSWNSRLA